MALHNAQHNDDGKGKRGDLLLHDRSRRRLLYYWCLPALLYVSIFNQKTYWASGLYYYGSIRPISLHGGFNSTEIMDSDLIALSRIRQANFPSTGAQALFRGSTDTRFHPSCHIYLVVRVITDFWSYPKIRHANNNDICQWNLRKADSKDKWAEVADTFLDQICVRSRFLESVKSRFQSWNVRAIFGIGLKPIPKSKRSRSSESVGSRVQSLKVRVFWNPSKADSKVETFAFFGIGLKPIPKLKSARSLEFF